MTIRRIVVGLTLLATSCATRNPPMEDEFVPGWSVEGSALSWLKSQQQADGHWGTAEHRVELTSFAALAFLSQGEMPDSAEFGQTVVNALQTLLRDAELETDLSGETRAILVWGLAEAFNITQHPGIWDAVRKQAGKLDFRQATPWHALAAQSLRLSDACPETSKQGIATMRSSFPSQTPDILSQATLASLALRAGDNQQAILYLEAVRRLSPTAWRTHESPLPSAIMLSTAFLWAGGRDYQEWRRTFGADVVAQQIRRKAVGWWTAESLGLTRKQLPDLVASDADVYVTSLVLLTFPPPRFLPSFVRGVRAEQDSAEDGEEIRIDIR